MKLGRNWNGKSEKSEMELRVKSIKNKYHKFPVPYEILICSKIVDEL